MPAPALLAGSALLAPLEEVDGEGLGLLVVGDTFRVFFI